MNKKEKNKLREHLKEDALEFRKNIKENENQLHEDKELKKKLKLKKS